MLWGCLAILTSLSWQFGYNSIPDTYSAISVNNYDVANKNAKVNYYHHHYPKNKKVYISKKPFTHAKLYQTGSNVKLKFYNNQTLVDSVNIK